MAHGPLHEAKHGPRHGAKHGTLTLGSTGGPIPTYVGAGTAASGVGALTPTIPTSVADDILILVVNNTHSSTSDATLTTAEGFTAIAAGAVNSGAYSGLRSHQTLFWKRATGSDNAPTVADNGEFNVARIYAYRDCVTTGDPWDVIGTDGDNDGNLTMTGAAGATTTGPNRLVCIFVTAFTGGAGSIAGWANADLAAITERDDASYNVAGDFVHIAHTTGEMAVAGAYGTTTATWSGSAYVSSACITLALKPTA